MPVSTQQRNNLYHQITEVILLAKEKDWQYAENLPVNFPAFIILDATKQISELDDWRKRTTVFLLKQFHANSKTLNWWHRSSSSFCDEPYPDDLDDTCCAWAAIAQTNPSLISPHDLAALTKVLARCEQQPGGPYATWLVPKTALQWRDTDLAVNCNIAYFLATQGITLPHVLEFIRKQLHQSYCSKYYPTAYPILYFFGRLYKLLPRKQQKMFDSERLHILSFLTQTGFQLKNQLNAALAVSTIVRLGCSNHYKDTLQSHLTTILKKKQFQSEPFCIHTYKHGVIKTAGSSLVTMALCAEALYLYDKWETQPQYQQSNSDIFVQGIYKKVFALICEKTHGVLKDHLLVFIRKSLRDPALSMTIQLHLFVYRAMENAAVQDITTSTLEQIAIAQFLGWIAYTLFDSIHDHEADNDAYLFCAVYCARRAQQLYAPFLQKSPWFASQFNTIMERMDCTQIKHRTMAYHALGCELGAMALVSALPVNARQTYADLLHTFFLHFLTAKQLSDDAKDAEYDVKHHIATPMTKHTQDRITYLCHRLTFHLKTCKKILHTLPLQYPQYLLNLLVPLETRLQAIQKDLKDTINFLSSYQRNDMLEVTDGASPKPIPADRDDRTHHAQSGAGATSA